MADNLRPFQVRENPVRDGWIVWDTRLPAEKQPGLTFPGMTFRTLTEAEVKANRWNTATFIANNPDDPRTPEQKLAAAHEYLRRTAGP